MWRNLSSTTKELILMFTDYYYLIKPGIVRGNLMTAVAAFLFASRGNIDFILLVFMALGLGLVIASGCVLNNILDRSIDAKMERTKKRALVTGRISEIQALIFASIIGVAGFLVLSFYTTPTASFSASIGFIFYVLVYGYAKRRTIYSTLIGSISGAVPPVVGYTAVTNTFDLAAVLLFLILCAWQMPHFYSIAIYRKSEYKNAEIPLPSVVKGVETVKKHITVFVYLFFLSAVSFYYLGYTGMTYLLVMTVVSIWWIVKTHKYQELNYEKWAKQMFGISLVVLLVFSVTISVDFFLP